MRHDQILAEQPPAQARQETEQRPRLQYAGARHVGDDDAVLAQHVDQAGHAEMRRRIELQRIEEIGIDPAQQHVEPLQPGDGADMDAVAADGEIVALDQQEAEIARQRGVFEIGLAEGARRQQSDPRLVAIGAGAQRLAERLEERRHALDIHRLVEVGKGARQHQAVFQRIARARRRLGAVVQHPPAAIGAAADIGRIEVKMAAAGRFDAADRAQIFVAAGNRGRRHRAIGDQPALAIEIAQHHFEQLGALRDARGQLLPIGLIDDERQMAERPHPVGGLAGRAIGDAGFAQMPVGGGEAAFDIGGRKGGKGLEEAAPGRTRRAVLADIFVGNAGQPRIIARPLRDPALARTGLALLIAALARHSDSLETRRAPIRSGAASSSRASRGIHLCVLRAAGRFCPGCGRGPGIAPAAALPPHRN